MRISDWSSDGCSSDLEVSVDVDIAYESVAVAPDGRAVVAEEVHARLKSGQDFVQVEAALVCFRVGPVLPGPDQCDVVVSPHYYASTYGGVTGDDLQFARGLHPVGLGDRKPLAHRTPVAVLVDFAADSVHDSSNPGEVVLERVESFELFGSRCND